MANILWGPWTGHLTKPMQVCYCDGDWICEQHPDKPYPHDLCIGPGMVCPRCYPDPARPPLPDGWQSIARADDDDPA